MDRSQSPLNLTASLFLASVVCGLSSVWMTASFLELWKNLMIFSFWLHFAKVFYLCFFNLNQHCLVLLFPPLRGVLGLMVRWMLHHVRGKEQFQSSPGWTAQYSPSTFTHFSFLSVCYFGMPQILSDSRLFRTRACNFPSFCWNHNWILQVLPITGLSYQWQEFQGISLRKDFCCQMGVATCLYQAVSNALLLAWYTMFLGFLTFIPPVVRQR